MDNQRRFLSFIPGKSIPRPKKKRKGKIRQWEDLADKAFFPDDYVNQVAVCLIKAQEDALSATNNMLATVGAALDYDLKKAVIILECIQSNHFKEYWMNMDGLNFILMLKESGSQAIQGIKAGMKFVNKYTMDAANFLIF